MKTFFIVNPVAGRGKIHKTVKKIKSILLLRKEKADIYITKSVGDAENFVKKLCSESKNEELFFIACGGDGTVNEVLNGIIKTDNARMSVLPIGTGNDFCRNFKGDFSDINSVLNGKTVDCDAIQFKGIIDNKPMTKYCANMFNIGFDCNVVDLAAKLKKLPLIAGPFAYISSVAANLYKKKGADLNIIADGEEVQKGALLLTSLANGSYCGGGVKGSPKSNVFDGLMELNIVKNISRTKFIKLFPSYANGSYPEKEKIKDVITTKICKSASIIPNAETMRLCVDGEIFTTQKIDFEIVKNAFKFVVPGEKI